MVYTFDVSFVLAMLFGWIIEEGIMQKENGDELDYISLHIYLLFLDIEITKVRESDYDDLVF